MDNIKFVKQLGRTGCGIACIMVADQTYDQVKTGIIRRRGKCPERFDLTFGGIQEILI